MPLADLATLTESMDAAERMLLARLKQLESSPDSQPAEALGNAIGDLARLTAVHKSLVYLDKFINAPPPEPPKPEPPKPEPPVYGANWYQDDPAPDDPDDPDDPDRVQCPPQKTSGYQIYIDEWRQKQREILAKLAAERAAKKTGFASPANSPSNSPSNSTAVRQPSIRQVAQIPAMPLNRIAPELNRITRALSDQIETAAPSSTTSIQSSSNPNTDSPSTEPDSSPQSTGSTQSTSSTSSTQSTQPAPARRICPTIIPDLKPPPSGGICSGYV